ncbi:gliding motility-associated ABC transporter substrate-binding protein GldG [Limibacter armeniacum]|uniref:gliding motility-associated ABC transporter substrate-binding protein GldG n=1 Tax=Limibacter armeniacum TaxID=466084 RepID=UPI002FE53731
MRQRKWEDILTFSAIVLAAILLNIYAGKFFFRWDLTEEKRYSIAPATEQMLSTLQDVVYIEVYLEGDLNAEFKRLQESVRETLEEFQVRSGGMVEFKFVDPNEAVNPQGRQRFYQQLAAKGIPQTNLFDVTPEGEKIQKVIFPGALVTFRGKEKGILLLKGNKAMSPQEQINQSLEGVEYELASAVQQLSEDEKKRIAFIQGHQELTPQETIDLGTTLNESYLLDYTTLDNPQLDAYDALILAQPKTRFSDTDKFYLDQYIMKGGNAMMLMDRIQMNTDSIPMGGTYGFAYDLNIEDLIFRYGIRLNTDLLQDQQVGLLEVVTGNFGNQPNVRPLPWPYYIYLNNFSEHPVVRNMDVVYGKFISSLDTVKADGVKKTPLIFTSQYSRVRNMPGMVTLDEMQDVKNREQFNQPNIPVAYLLEGQFKSLYANRYVPKGARPQEVVKQSKPAKLIVVGDGDIIRNELDRQTGRVIPIDFDKYRQETLSNKEFILNALSYLTDEDGLINARNKRVTLRPLDQFKLREEKLFWQVLNIAGPVVLVLLFGVLRYYWRKRKYENKGL